MDAIKVLMVDDEERMRKLVKDFLTIKGYRVVEAGDGEEAIDIFFKEKDISLVILDVMMPKMDGWEVCKTIRRYSQVPIIMLTARSEERDELLGFELGVDEYISKPFSPKELMARVGAVLKRNRKTPVRNSFTYRELEIRPASRIASVAGKELVLAPKEFDLLLELAKNPATVLRRDKLLQDVWGYSYFGDGRTVDTHVKSVRDRLGPYRAMIQTVWGVGYKFDPDVKIENL